MYASMRSTLTLKPLADATRSSNKKFSNKNADLHCVAPHECVLFSNDLGGWVGSLKFVSSQIWCLGGWSWKKKFWSKFVSSQIWCYLIYNFGWVGGQNFSQAKSGVNLFWVGGPEKNFGPNFYVNPNLVFPHFGWLGGPGKIFSSNLCQAS